MDTDAPLPVPRDCLCYKAMFASTDLINDTGSSPLADSEADEPFDPLPTISTTNITVKRRNLMPVEPKLQALSDLRDEHDRVMLAQEIQAEKERYEKETIEFEWEVRFIDIPRSTQRAKTLNNIFAY